MKIGPDGSLPRITSSSKSITSNLKIAKVADEDGISKTGFLYKLVFTGENEESEVSEKSDDEAWSDEAWSEEDIPDANPSEKDKSRESTDLSNQHQSMVESRPQNVECERPYNNNSKRNRGRSRYRYVNKKNLKGSFNNSSNEDRNNFNSNTRSYGSSGIYGNKYKTLQETPDPWVVPPMVGPNHQIAFACHPTYMPTHMDPLMQVPPPNPVPQKPKSVGLLGDSPYSPHNFRRRLDFPPNKQGEEFSSHQKKYQASNIKDSFHPHPQNYQLEYQSSKQDEEFLLHPPNYEPNSNNDEFEPPPVNYQASTSNEKFIPRPPNFEATDKIRGPPNYNDKQYNRSYSENHSNRQRFSHYPFRGQFKRKSFHNPGTHWSNNDNRQHENNYRCKSGRARRNDRRHASDRFNYKS